MYLVETVFHREHWEADLRLSQMDMVRSKLLSAVQVARTEALNARTNFHAANAGGTFAYQNGIWALRYHFVSPDSDWQVDRAEGVESIRNDKLKLRVGFSNVDAACLDSHVPQPRTAKGSGAERISHPNLFDHLPSVTKRPSVGAWSFFYLMVDDKGWAELTQPVVRSGKFVSAVERIYLAYGQDGGSKVDLLDDHSDVVSNFDPKIERRG